MDFHHIHMFLPSVRKGYLLASCTKVLGDESHLISQFWWISTFWTSIPGKQGQQMFGLLSSWNFHHVNMTLVGGLIRCKRIYNFWCCMLVLHQFLYVLFTLRGTFMHFLELTYWQVATVPVPVFCCFCVSEKLHRKYSRNWTKQIAKFLFSRDKDEVRRRVEGGPQGGHTMPRRG